MKTEIPAIRAWRVVQLFPQYSILNVETFLTMEGAQASAKGRVMENGFPCLILEIVAIVEPEGKPRERTKQLQTTFRI